MNDNLRKQVPILEDGIEYLPVDENLPSMIKYLWDRQLDIVIAHQDNEQGIVYIRFMLASWMDLTTVAFNKKALEL